MAIPAVGWTLTAKYTASDLVAAGALPPQALEACAACVPERRNVLVTKVAGTGKTTLLRALTGLLSVGESALLLDDTGELHAGGPCHERMLVRRGELVPSAAGGGRARSGAPQNA